MSAIRFVDIESWSEGLPTDGPVAMLKPALVSIDTGKRSRLFLCLQPNNTLQWQSLPAKSTPSTLMSGPFAWMLSPVVAGVECVDVAPGLERGPAVGSFTIQPL
jgi:hypothetical protein